MERSCALIPLAHNLHQFSLQTTPNTHQHQVRTVLAVPMKIHDDSFHALTVPMRLPPASSFTKLFLCGNPDTNSASNEGSFFFHLQTSESCVFRKLQARAIFGHPTLVITWKTLLCSCFLTCPSGFL